MYQLFVILHVLAATIWIGGHIVLSTVVLPRALSTRDANAIREFETRYERIGIPSLLILIVTGVWLANHWLPAAHWLAFQSPLSHSIVTKLGLLLLTLVLAVHARLRIVPTLDETKLRALAFHIVSVTIISIAFLVVGVGIRAGGLF